MNHPLSPPPLQSSHSHSQSQSHSHSQSHTVLLDYPPRSPEDGPHSAITLLPPSPASSSPDSAASNSHLRSSPPLSSSATQTRAGFKSLGPNSSQDDQDLFELFSTQCKKMFYDGDPHATKSVEQIIKHLPAASKAAFTKQMASIRSQFHRDAASSRRAEVDKLLLDTLPSSVIIKSVGNDSSLSAMRSPRARQERKDRLKKFINAHCVRNMVGVHPFFSSLCAVLHLLLIPARKGGSGKRRIEWDIDLALFCEAGGEPFLRDSIEFLKGVLGFEDHLKSLAAPSFVSSSFDHTVEGDEDDDVPLDMIIGHPDGDDGLTLEERQELEVDEEFESARELTPAEIARAGATEEEGPFADSSSASVEEEESGSGQRRKGKAVADAGRGRAISDPFLDPRPTVATPIPLRPTRISPQITVSPAVEDPPGSTSSTPKATHAPLPVPQHRRSPTQNSLDAPPPSEIRIFRSPSYLTNPELRELIETFPSFISIRCRSLRFNSAGIVDGTGKTVGEKRNAGNGNNGTGLIGHGLIRLSVFERDENWKGTFLERIKLFFFRMFGI
ncbi:hypothetical protein CROQUDRAFT_663278 [Cronartium quercuum f. sp. fusiforme G11]|uniref:Uncharacterized protein n=1 Tax=Cronartium quercuum f. sp. fusiforme G11 TaxID=708437 RepID=A0A9P6N932_9BASI|nr:hypothetical protein CROQUDRAFT_663278 [Cronartium quercuum f. sp. fusiforme G11]